MSCACVGQDRVTVQPRDGSNPIVLLGHVLDYTGSILTIRLANGLPQIIEADTITGVETFYEPAHREALAAFRAGDAQLARDHFEAALKRESRTWVQREIMAGLVKLHNRRGDLLASAQQFLTITQSDPVTRHWGLAPLVWAPSTLSSAMIQQGRSWLGGDSPDARLLGASWLLFDNTYGEPAHSELKRLCTHTNERISALARSQLWRVSMATGTVSEEILQSWKGDIHRLPSSMRAGPQYLLAHGFRLRGELTAAAAEYLWLPLVYSENEPLAARALLLAAQTYAERNLTRESQTLYAELLTRYAWSAEAQTAQQVMRPPN